MEPKISAIEIEVMELEGSASEDRMEAPTDRAATDNP
jgi:hypothetical protein